VFHEVLEHRWFLSEQAGGEVPIEEAASGYMREILRQRPDEELALTSLSEPMGALANPYDPSQGFADDEEDRPYDPWEDSEESSDGGPEPAVDYLDISALRNRKASLNLD